MAQGRSCSLGIGTPVDVALALWPMETGLAFYPQTPHTHTKCATKKIGTSRRHIWEGKNPTS